MIFSSLFTFLVDETTVHIIFLKDGGRKQRNTAEWGSWSVVREFEPATFASAYHQLVRLATFGQCLG